MSYQITNSDGSFLLTLNPYVVDQSTTCLYLVGQNTSGYGDYINQNFVNLLQNSASANPPRSPQIGQLWYNKTSSVLNIYNSSDTYQTLATQAWVESLNVSLGTQNSAYFASQSYVIEQLANLVINTQLTGVPTAPTAAPGTDTIQLATTAFVEAAIGTVNVPHTLSATGDVTGSASIGTGNASLALTLATTGVTPGTYNSVVVDAKGRVISAQELSSNLSVETPPQFDNSTNIATTAFVQRALGNFQGSIVITNHSPASLTTANFGSIVTLISTTSTTYSTAIPDTPDYSGVVFMIWNNSSVPQTLQATASLFYGPYGTGTNSFSILAGELIYLLSNGTNWIVYENKMRTSVGPSTWNFNNQSGQPSYVWGTADGLTMQAYNPSNFSVAVAGTASAVTWNNVSGKPTDLSYFTNDTNYIAAGIRTASGIAVGSPTGNCVPSDGTSTGTYSISNCVTYLNLNTSGSFSLTYDVTNCSSTPPS